MLELVAIYREISGRIVRCPTCRDWWWYSGSKHVHVGREFYVCGCGLEHPTGCIEWAHLNALGRRRYFFSQLTILWLIGVGVLPMVLVSPFIPRGDLVYIFLFSALATLAPMLPVWLFKYWNVQQSLSRLPREWSESVSA
jgi:hypothetical protein